MTTWRTETGRILTEEDLDRMADEVEHAEVDFEAFLERAVLRPKRYEPADSADERHAS